MCIRCDTEGTSSAPPPFDSRPSPCCSLVAPTTADDGDSTAGVVFVVALVGVGAVLMEVDEDDDEDAAAADDDDDDDDEEEEDDGDSGNLHGSDPACSMWSTLRLSRNLGKTKSEGKDRVRGSGVRS